MSDTSTVAEAVIERPEAEAVAESGHEGAAVAAQLAEFAEMSLESELANAGAKAPPPGGIDRLLDVTVSVSVELGRVTVPIGDVLKLGVGSVLELERTISEPVDLVAQGILLARGEVVVVDDRFAIRVKEIAEPKKRS